MSLDIHDSELTAEELTFPGFNGSSNVWESASPDLVPYLNNIGT